MADPLVDNDVVLKVCCYGLDAALITTLAKYGGTPAMLPLARYVVLGRIKRDRSLQSQETALAALERVLKDLGIVEPDEAEIHLAASFEAAAQARNLELDGGESQLLAILISRGLKLLITGDKRAVRAIEELAADKLTCGSIACLEQLIATILAQLGPVVLRQHICAEPAADRALTACFACRSSVIDLASIEEGLRSYIADLRKVASKVLVGANDLSGLVA
ncbi:hypothetical protein BAE42_16195 [Mesorhizobium loti]|uniref:PIN domain-containing protein n=1 Tax=Mesorhizobium erdmanii TaxID=1777866 RepID=A0A6M7UP64_9HYPH|nr:MULTISPECIES: hypothetical protein [Mesorhizobium]OBP72350.1 hypothetical protein BAE42_16195 [Mesorhizobium loti]OBQ62575.1 hypothetical protein A8146_15695 [Mesorhizobium loti]QKC79051.1 hypothetical protein EB233_29055 [Mesorhizobium erdmanii]